MKYDKDKMKIVTTSSKLLEYDDEKLIDGNSVRTCTECKETKTLHEYAQNNTSIRSKEEYVYIDEDGTVYDNAGKNFKFRRECSECRKSGKSKDSLNGDRVFKKYGVPGPSCVQGCELCGHVPLAGERKLSKDHCHKNETPRGYLCTKCNTGLGNFPNNSVAEGDLEFFKRIVEYLENVEGDKWMEKFTTINVLEEV
jgi:hypothetical protein